MTNNTKRLVGKINTEFEIVDLSNYNKIEKYILITPTYNFGDIPDKVQEFLKAHGLNMVGVISTGNKNWGTFYGQAGDKIADLYDVPLLHKLEMSGNKKDVEIINNILERYY